MVEVAKSMVKVVPPSDREAVKGAGTLDRLPVRWRNYFNHRLGYLNQVKPLGAGCIKRKEKTS